MISCKCDMCNFEYKRSKLFIKSDLRWKKEKVKCPNCFVLEKQDVIESRTKTCPTCNTVFVKAENIYCSSRCAAIKNNSKRVYCERVRIDKLPSTVKVELTKRSTLRYIEPKTCRFCKINFLPLSKESKYCSLNCSAQDRRKMREDEIENLIKSGRSLSTDLNNNNAIYRRYLIRKFGPKCMKCGWSKINQFSKKVPIELEHKDGNCINNNLDNLELLCPNYHSLSKFYKGANKRVGGSPRYALWKKHFSK